MKKPEEKTTLEMVPVRKMTRPVNFDALKFSIQGPAKAQNINTSLSKSLENKKNSSGSFDSQIKVEKTNQWHHNMYYTIEEHMTHQVTV